MADITTLLCGKHKGIISEYAPDDIGVSQGSPISDQLFTIYAANVVNEYKNTLNNSNILPKVYNFRNYKLEHKWKTAKYQMRISKMPWVNGNLEPPTQTHTIDHALSADGARLDRPDIDSIYPKLQIYNNVENENPL